MNNLDLNSIPIAQSSKKDMVCFLTDAINQSKSFLPVVTFNITMINTHSTSLLNWLKKYALFTPDGIGISLLLFFKHFKWVQRYPGIDMVMDVLTQQNQSYRIALIGSSDTAILKTSDMMSMLGHDIVYCKNGFSPVLETDFQTIAKSQPQLILVAMGCPKQDEFIYSLSNHLNSGVAIGVGGSFDVWSGILLEWLVALF